MNDSIKVLIADDELEARNALHTVLKEFDNVQVVGITGNPGEILTMVTSNLPDIVFLDIEMPGKSGLEVADEIRKSGMNTTIVFVTAYNKFAIEAFKVAAFDYLLKPVAHEMISELLKRFTATPHHALDQKLETLFNHFKNGQKIRINIREGFHLVAGNDIFYIKADTSYCTFYYCNQNTETISLHLGAIEEALPRNQFFRISRSQIINLDYLESVNRRTKTCTISRYTYSETLKVSADRIKLLDLRMR